MEKNTLLIIGTSVGYALKQCCTALEIKSLLTYENPGSFGFGKLKEQHFGSVGEKLFMNPKILKIANKNNAISCDAIVIDLSQSGALDFCIKLRLEGHKIPVKSLTSLGNFEEELKLLPSTHRLIDYLKFISNPPEPSNNYFPVIEELLKPIISRAHSIIRNLKENLPNNEEEAKLVLNDITNKDKEIGDLVVKLSEKYEGSVYETLLKLID